jgi:hypothetical protein
LPISYRFRHRRRCAVQPRSPYVTGSRRIERNHGINGFATLHAANADADPLNTTPAVVTGEPLALPPSVATREAVLDRS